MPDRTPLVFLPGLLCDDRLWRDQAAALADIAEPAIADLTLDDSLAAMAARVLAGAPERFALAALSMGGYCGHRNAAAGAGAHHPAGAFGHQRGTRYAGAGGATPRSHGAPEAGPLPRRDHAHAAAAGPCAPCARSRHVQGAVGDEVRAMARRVGGAAFLRQQQAIPGRPDSRPLLPSIRIPTLVAVGDSDVL